MAAIAFLLRGLHEMATPRGCRAGRRDDLWRWLPSDDEVTVIVGFLGLSAAALGFSASRQWWLMAVGLGVGVGLHNRLYRPPPPFHQDARHLALYGPPQPFHLPFGLTGNHFATTVAVALILMSFLFVATGIGSIARGFIERVRATNSN
jgi:hypothetical protein